MRRIAHLPLLLSVILLAFACEQTPSKHDYHGYGEDLPGLDLTENPDVPYVPDPDVVVPPSDTPSVPDGEGPDLVDVESPEDGVEPPEDVGDDTGGETPLECGDVLFEYAAAPGVQEIFVSGSFNAWADSAATADVLEDADGDGVWSVVLHLDPGVYQYKFVVDGEWMADPANPDKVDDGYGGFNSVVTVPECAGPGDLVLEEHETDPSGTFYARFVAQGGEPLKASDVTVTVDWKPASADSVSVDGQELEINLEGLAKGIHDVRVEVGDEVYLLKVYVGISTDWREAILYFVMTDRFVNGSPGNDKPVADVDWRTNYQGGDFAGVTAKIEEGYFDELGVGAIWLSWPVDNPDGFHDGGRPSQHYCGMDPKTAPMEGTRYTGFHGYWPSKLYETDEHFGTLEELQTLVTTAHAHGIRILLDFTANHVHESSPFYLEHKDDGFFHFPAEICQDVGWDNKPVTCWFTSYLPDLNYSNPAAVKAVLDYAMYWAKTTGSDGFRLDAVKHIELDFVKALRARAKKEMELTGVDFYIVGETFTGDAGLIKSFVGPDKIHGQFDFPANLNILQGFATQEKGLAEMDAAVRSAKEVYGPGAVMSNFLGNHDIARFTSMAAGMISCGIWDVVSNIAQGWLNPPGQPSDETPYRKLRLAFTYVMTIPGIPLIYYGDEYGMPGAGDPDNRRMATFGDNLSPHEKGTLEFLRTLGKARAAHPALAKGDWIGPLWSEADFLAYARTTPGDRVLVLLNRGGAEKSGALDLTATLIPGGTKLTDVFSGTTVTVDQNLQFNFTVPPLTAAIYVVQ